jgi:mono/diheme cytochrome c family protein
MAAKHLSVAREDVCEAASASDRYGVTSRENRPMGERRMAGRAGIALVLATVASCAWAQEAPDPASLSDTERLGQKLFYQSCGVCHTKPQITSAQFGPVLSKASADGREDVIRGIIADGSPRMPGFKYHFDSKEIAAIVAYLKKVPEPAQPPAR